MPKSTKPKKHNGRSRFSPYMRVLISARPTDKPATTATATQNDFENTREAEADSLLIELEEKLGKGRIAEATKQTGGVQIIWAKRLLLTAGYAHYRDIKTADGRVLPKVFIKLSSTLLDQRQKLLDTLVHEYCHLMVCLVDKDFITTHGPGFMKWGKLAEEIFSDYNVKIEATHNYAIKWKYYGQCGGRRGILHEVFDKEGNTFLLGGCPGVRARVLGQPGQAKPRCKKCGGKMVELEVTYLENGGRRYKLKKKAAEAGQGVSREVVVKKECQHDGDFFTASHEDLPGTTGVKKEDHIDG
ncbi:SprT-like family-domain-containing protein [Elsinoe ampelina]|uniref:SprT-like family-domain-containing protein n=1 Tax=Elsinoe ampelina TaxID=302913 RepID=A0A6A6GPG7_9PEZI|nr:SprT-like family-domain-containing protein [Elsinoe ampelina]